MIECPKCGHDNDLGRIFCVECGEKLDISKVSAPSGIRRRKKGGSAQSKGQMIGGAVVKVIKLTFLAAVCAVLTLLWLQPDFQRKTFGVNELASYVANRTQMEDALRNQQSAKIVLTEPEVNAAMAKAIIDTTKGQKDAGEIKLESIYFRFADKSAIMTAQNKVKWFRLSVQVKVSPVKTVDKWHFKVDRVWVGRLPFPAFLNDRVVDSFIKRLFADFGAERELIEKMDAVELKTGELTLASKTTS
jgi:hypothetical protein